MWTQKDQLQAYEFLRRRHVSALLTGDANHPVAPGRRLVFAYLVGATVLALLVAGFAVFAILRR